jgi:predicted nuclease with TOPRIM domain
MSDSEECIIVTTLVTSRKSDCDVAGAAVEQLNETGRQSGNQVYDPSRFKPSPPDRQEDIKRLEEENGMLREKLSHLEEDYYSLQEKRLQDVSVTVLLLKLNYRSLQAECLQDVSTASLGKLYKITLVCRENVCRMWVQQVSVLMNRPMSAVLNSFCKRIYTC